jgi:photosystem II stability/assembly factor-like uncharacterized protein
MRRASLLHWLARLRAGVAALVALTLVGCGSSEPRPVSRTRVTAVSEPSFCLRIHGTAALDDGDESSGSFPTASVGWILFTPEAMQQAGGVGVCDSMLRVTTDGARSFRAVRIPAEPFAAVVSDSPQDVWLIGRRSYASVNGGRQWRPVGLPSGVEQVILGDHAALAIAEVCVKRERCGVEFLRSVDGGQAWRRHALPRDTSDQLVARGSLVALVTSTRILISDNGGRTFTSRRSACSAFEKPLVAIDPADTIWELCVDEPGAGSQEKVVFKSDDLGRHWTEPLRWTPQTPPTALDLGYAGTLATPADATLVLTEARGGLTFSDDGGRHWIDTIPDINDADPASGWLSFPTPARGYAWIYENHVFSTTNGGRSWQPVPIRPLN